MFGQLWRRIQHLFSKNQFDEELEEEIRLHQELRAEKLKQAGLSEKDARSQAKKQFGNTSLLKESSRETWRWSLLENLGQDLRYAWRQMMANKVLSLSVLFTLTLGIGATTSIFSIFEAIILRSLAVPHPEQLYLLQTDTDLFTSALSHPLFTRMQKKLPEGSSLTANTRATRGPCR